MRRWTPPQEGWAKLNLDAGFIDETGRASTGVIIRDVHGKVLLSAWRSLYHIASVVEAEALACLEGLCLARQWISLPLCVETDCKQLVQALEKEDQDRSSWAGLIKELKGAIQLLPEVRLNHVRREQNQAAHNLAQLALRQVVCKTTRFSMG
jgi:ribonuclease HI